MVVGAHRIEDEEIRIHEYSPRFDPERFAAHEDFFVSDIGTWIRSKFDINLPPQRTAVNGCSAGAELALAMGGRHPGRFGVILAASPGAGYHPPENLPASIPRTYMVAGLQEPFSLENAM